MPAAGCLWQLGRRRAWRNPAETPWVALGLWVIGVLGLAILVPFRLPHYGLPAYPAIALLAARGWRDLGARWLAGLHAALFAARRSGRARGAARECRGAALVQPAAGRRRRRSPQRAGLRRLDPGGAGRALADAAPATGLARPSARVAGHRAPAGAERHRRPAGPPPRRRRRRPPPVRQPMKCGPRHGPVRPRPFQRSATVPPRSATAPPGRCDGWGVWGPCRGPHFIQDAA